MRYREIPPPAYLKDYVRYFWTLEDQGTTTTQQPRAFRAIADGCPGLIFQSSHEGYFFQPERRLPGIFIYGQATAPTEFHASGRLNAIGVFFYPNALKAVFGLDAFALTDTCLDANTIRLEKEYDIQEKLLNAVTTEEKVNLLSAWLWALAQQNDLQHDAVIKYAVSQITGSKGGIPLKDLLANIQLSERSFERKFKATIGLSPKLFARICRFQASLQQLKNSDYQKLSDIAYENDYADQSHFIRAFKEFAGFSPWQFQKQSPEVLDNLTVINP
jgi:AraC-like DNA-binding protein